MRSKRTGFAAVYLSLSLFCFKAPLAGEGTGFPFGSDRLEMAASVCCIGNVADSFSDGNLTPLWIDQTTCGTAAETAGQLVLTRPPGCDYLDGPGVWLDSAYIICGNFDIQIDFNLTNWPAPAGEHTANFFVSSGIEYFVIGRHRAVAAGGCIPYQQSYKAWQGTFNNCTATWVQSSDLSGKFRITRSGTTLSSYYWNSPNWVLVRTGTMTTTQVFTGLYTESTDGTAATVAFDNLSIQSFPPPDGDGDGVPNCIDNCTAVVNPLQEDSDADLVGDSCDNCPFLANGNQSDSDEDGVGDPCDNCPAVVNPSQENSDSDLVGDSCDNCPTVVNNNQLDQDQDGLGNACDICPSIANPLQQHIEPGDADANNSHNLADLISAVNYIFGKPGWPVCSSNTLLCWLSDLTCRGDWNGNGGVALDDIIRGVNFIFGKPGGPWNPVPIGVCCVPAS